MDIKRKRIEASILANKVDTETDPEKKKVLEQELEDLLNTMDYRAKNNYGI